jgi:hypothetical protein
MASYIREQTLGRIVSGAFGIYGKNFLALYLTYFIPVLPFTILSAIGASNHDEVVVGVASLLGLFATFFSIGAVTIAVSDICLGNRPSVTRSWQLIGRVFWVYTGVFVSVGVIILVGFIAVLVPGLIAIVMLMFALTVCVIERKGVRESIKRSAALGKGHYWRNFGVWFVASLVVGLVMVAAMIVALAPMLLFGTDEDDFLFHFVQGLLTSLAAPLGQIAIVLLYYDMRVRKENFDGAALAQELLT